MKKSNKILAVVLALVMMLTAVPMMTAGATDEHVHKYALQTLTVATCTTDGEMTFKCSCGDVLTKVYEAYHVPAPWNGKMIDKVNDNQHKEFCGECEEFIFSAHTWPTEEDAGYITVTKAPTCEETGKAVYECVDDCGATKEVVLPKTAHTPGNAVIDGDKHIYNCAVCEVKVEEAHTWNDGVVETPALCNSDGKLVKTCTVCDKTKEEVIPAGHNMSEVPSSCTAEGHVYNCLNGCGYKETVAIETDFVVIKLANCTEEGKLVIYCNDCLVGRYEQEYAIAITGHNFTEYEQYTDTQHKAICEDCGEPSYNDHVWGEGVVTKPATCAEAGEKTFTCVCGATKKEVIPVTTTHTMDNGVITTPAACETDGVKTYTCTVCGAKETEAISKTGHNVTTWTVKTAATCGAKGVEEGTCTVCGEKQTREIPMVGEHTWGEWKVTREPSILWKGEETRECSVCGAKETREYVKPENPDEPEYKVGDVNGDNTVGAVDARMILRYVADLIELSEDELARADVDGNGQVQAVDARKILRMLVEQE